MPKPPSPSGCSKRHKVPGRGFRGRGAAPGAALGICPGWAPLSLGQVLIAFNHHLPSSLSSPQPERSPAERDVLCSPWSCREVLSQPYNPVHTAAGINPWGKAGAVMEGGTRLKKENSCEKAGNSFTGPKCCVRLVNINNSHGDAPSSCISIGFKP